MWMNSIVNWNFDVSGIFLLFLWFRIVDDIIFMLGFSRWRMMKTMFMWPLRLWESIGIHIGQHGQADASWKSHTPKLSENGQEPTAEFPIFVWSPWNLPVEDGICCDGQFFLSSLETFDFYVKYLLFCHLAVELWSVPSCFLQLQDFIVLEHWCFLHFKQSKHALCEALGLNLWHRGKFWLKTLPPGRWDSLQNSNSFLILEIFDCTRTISSCGLHGMYTFLSLLECECQDVTSQPENMSCSPLESKAHLQEICKHSKFTEFCHVLYTESTSGKQEFEQFLIRFGVSSLNGYVPSRNSAHWVIGGLGDDMHE